jgi:predicted dehydrogenase
MKTDNVNLAVIGVGNMGALHARECSNLMNARLLGVCDIDEERANRLADELCVKPYHDYRDLLGEPGLDAVVIATPHYDHTPISIIALERGIHVLTEKPVAVHRKDAHKMNTAYDKARENHPKLVFACMFQQRTYGHWIKIKKMIDEGELGRLVRATWIITDWFRSQAYYDHGGWRATWRGEGGGALLNQCPHNLDLYQWFFGMPARVTGFASLGKYHNIEVEDEVTGYLEHEGGMVGHFITSTGESPGTNRLEITGELGKLVFEDGIISFSRNSASMLEFIRSTPKPFDKVETTTIEVPFEQHSEWAHRVVLENFVDAIQRGASLIAPAVEGIHSLSLGNAIMLSSWLDQTVTMPFDEDAYERLLEERISRSRFQKVVRDQGPVDISNSFS